MTTQFNVRTIDGVVHAFRTRQDGSLRWIGMCGARLLLPVAETRIDETIDCMSCLVHEARQ